MNTTDRLATAAARRQAAQVDPRTPPAERASKDKATT